MRIRNRGNENKGVVEMFLGFVAIRHRLWRIATLSLFDVASGFSPRLREVYLHHELNVC